MQLCAVLQAPSADVGTAVLIEPFSDMITNKSHSRLNKQLQDTFDSLQKGAEIPYHYCTDLYRKIEILFKHIFFFLTEFS